VRVLAREKLLGVAIWGPAPRDQELSSPWCFYLTEKKADG